MTTRDVSPFEPRSRERREALRSCGGSRTLFLELEELRRYEQRDPGDPGKGTQARAAALAAGVRRPTLASDDLDAAA